ncbi:TPA: hypothetical protein ACJIQ0_001671 [Pseudomonas aeruginosa]
MQANQPQGGTKASTTTSAARTRPAMANKRLDLPSICDICGNARSTGKHQRCSRIRQQAKAVEWASYMANLAARKAQGGIALLERSSAQTETHQ